LNGIQISALAVSKSEIEADCAGMLFVVADNRGIVHKSRVFLQVSVNAASAPGEICIQYELKLRCGD